MERDAGVGQLVRAARRARGLSQEALADVVSMPQANLSAIETGRRTPSATTLQRLLAGCGFELAAVAGPLVLAAPDPELGPAADEPPALDPTATPETRAAVVCAALDVASAIALAKDRPGA